MGDVKYVKTFVYDVDRKGGIINIKILNDVFDSLFNEKGNISEYNYYLSSGKFFSKEINIL